MSVSTAAERAIDPGETPALERQSRRSLLWAIIPLLLLAAVLALIVRTDAGLGDRTVPPIETLSVQRITLPAPGQIELEIVNGGPDPITIAQVLVDEAYWQFSMTPAGPLSRLDSATLSIPYPWVEGETHGIALVSATGVMFEAEIPVAVESPRADQESFLRFALVGLYVGVVPVALGLLWFPFLRGLGRTGMNFVLALTIGLLAFLVVDMWQEAQESAAATVGALDAVVLIPLVAVLTMGLLMLVGHTLRRRQRERDRARGSDGERSPLVLAYEIALGIGLHNLGEGLAIGAAFALGEAALGVFLILGFTLHNVTEGIGIAAPLVRERPALVHFVGLALLAGAPAILGTWVGAFVYSPFWTTIFLAIGIGAILQVIVEVARLIRRSQERAGEPAVTWATFGGATLGVAVMYLTALLVAA
jgi:ZIP family zinc transporter